MTKGDAVKDGARAEDFTAQRTSVNAADGGLRNWRDAAQFPESKAKPPHRSQRRHRRI